MLLVPHMPRSQYYHEDVTTYQIAQTDLVYGDGRTQEPYFCNKVLFSSTSARMTWLMLREMNKYEGGTVGREVHVVYQGKVYGMLIFQFMNMVHSSYIYHDQGKDSPFIEWIEVHEPQAHTTVTVYSGTWYETYREVAKWSPEHRKQVHVAVMRQQRPTAEYNPPYVEYAYRDADEFWQAYDNWCVLMSYDKHADYIPWSSEVATA